jgi:peptidoglycan-N-acetylmuramic acid deacetylase
MIVALFYIIVDTNLKNSDEAKRIAVQEEVNLLNESANESSESEAEANKSTTEFSYGNYIMIKNTDSINSISFSYVMNDTGARPTTSLTPEEAASYNSIYIGKDIKNLIYLTFNENSINLGTSAKLDILARNKIKATFFVNKEFIENDPTLVKRMADEGHIVGVTLSTDTDVSDLATNDPEKIISEISMVEESFKNATGTDITKLFRFPEGIYSDRALNYINQLGYKSVFWSYTSFDKGDENTKDRSLQLMKSYNHQGAIYALDGSNVGCSAALDEFISFLTTKKYVFDLVSNA